GDPDRLTIQLPPADLDATEELMAQYAASWDFPAREVARWRASVTPSAQAGPNDDDTGQFTYGTRVFTGANVGFVHLEFQVAHHQRDREFVAAALFTWDRSASRSGG